MNAILHFTTTGRYHCDGLAQLFPGLRDVRTGGELEDGEHGCPDCPRFIRCGMSHVVSVDIQITDIAALKVACDELGLAFKHSQKTHKWYGQWVQDYNASNAAYRQGIKPEDYGKCVHAIGVPGSGYEVGVVKHPSGTGYTLVWDFFGTGRDINKAIGDNAEKLKQHYGVAKATIIAKSKGYMVNRTTLPNGSIRLQVTGM